jgi:hypothetical protein
MGRAEQRAGAVMLLRHHHGTGRVLTTVPLEAAPWNVPARAVWYRRLWNALVQFWEYVRFLSA